MDEPAEETIKANWRRHRIGLLCLVQSDGRLHRLSPKHRFKHENEYYGTIFHELAHWTGHESRLNRGHARFGDHSYAEELVAELSSCFTLAGLGLSVPESDSNSTAYVANWVSALNKDSRFVFRAAEQCQQGCGPDPASAVSRNWNPKSCGRAILRLCCWVTAGRRLDNAARISWTASLRRDGDYQPARGNRTMTAALGQLDLESAARERPLGIGSTSIALPGIARGNLTRQRTWHSAAIRTIVTLIPGPEQCGGHRRNDGEVATGDDPDVVFESHHHRAVGHG